MLSVHPQDIQHYHQHRQAAPSLSAASPFSPPPTPSYSYGLPSADMPHRVSPSPVLSRAALAVASPPSSKTPQDAAVAQALEIARESPDGASDPTVSNILEHALAHTWSKVTAQPDSYVMTKDEFAVFNFFQHRFVGDELAIAARKRYWDNTHA
ncbi:hypothetical protein HIM_01122 [Hirsutella minnesotensis 3608]|nr:hypothetical protein HIM_01122 [Hirsutella minnesotensis 3608]